MLRFLPDDVLSPQWREHDDAADLFDNLTAQPLLARVQMATWDMLQPLLPQPLAMAGYSVGEMAALYACGCMAREDVMSLTHLRATVMSQCADKAPSGMMATSGLMLEELVPVAQQHGMYLAIRIGPDAAVFGGLRRDLLSFQKRVEDMGAKITCLSVSLASHTPLMGDATLPLTDHLQQLRLNRPQTPWVSNYTGDVVLAPASIANAVIEQTTHTVLWDHCMQSLYERGVRCLLEIGPGHNLSRMYRARFNDVTSRSADEFYTRDALIAWVHSAT